MNKEDEVCSCCSGESGSAKLFSRVVGWIILLSNMAELEAPSLP